MQRSHLQALSWKRGASVVPRVAPKKKGFSQTGVLVCRYDDPDSFPFDEPDFDPSEDSETILTGERDSFVDQAKSEMAKLFEEHPETVFYQRQLQVMFEKRYFHWVTVRALTELVQEGVLATEVLPLSGTGTIVFYRALRTTFLTCPNAPTLDVL
jgi:hypothetical protein